MALEYRRDPKRWQVPREDERERKREREKGRENGSYGSAASDVTQRGCLGRKLIVIHYRTPGRNFPRHGALCTAIIYAPIIARGIMREAVD